MEVVDVHKKVLVKNKYNDLQHWMKNPKHVYIGRHNHYVGAPHSKWANPYSAKKYGREECIKMYRTYVLNNAELMSSLDELKGKKLGCWCAPLPCHGDVLVELCNK